MKLLLLPLLALGLAGCVLPEGGPAYRTYDGIRANAVESGPVRLGQGQILGDIVVTPYSVTEDSRCPANVQCVWAGTVKVAVRIDGPGWRESAEINLREPLALRGSTVRLARVEPAKEMPGRIATENYRFTFSD